MRTKKETNQSLVLKYNGCLGGADAIYLHYGIGEGWDNISECKMRKLKTCYKTEVTIPAGVELRFCFRDANDNWDNNYGSDYSYNGIAIEGTNIEVSPYIPKSR